VVNRYDEYINCWPLPPQLSSFACVSCLEWPAYTVQQNPKLAF